MSVCGCDRGSQLCSEAERLWAAVTAAYRAALARTATWDDYDETIVAYQRHFGEREVRA